MSNPQADAAKTVKELFLRTYGSPIDDPSAAKLDDFVRDVVVQLGRLMRPVAEEQVRSSGWISPDECREHSARMVNAGIADYCREKRLAIQDVKIPLGDQTMIAMLALDEAYYKRLANRPTHKEQR